MAAPCSASLVHARFAGQVPSPASSIARSRLLLCQAASTSSAHAPFPSFKCLLLSAMMRNPDSSLPCDLPRLPFSVSHAIGGGAVVPVDHIGRRCSLPCTSSPWPTPTRDPASTSTVQSLISIPCLTRPSTWWPR
ncbi:uncharacterized protein LOC100217099 [Zea mays]|uniref:Uncharacterized protein n=1 Tax=Zea mays TaxID=4577 RepID=B4FLD9_MAIZE|nr:uncharacterized protein LOC100217099 [Zea mays]ACF82932.1 unknown [Zea mays]|eukprot:NP_001136940.1 uncharacterized protein LOC100217099 [Zea mays]